MQKFKKSIQEERCGRKLTDNEYELLNFLQGSGKMYKTAIKRLKLNNTQPIPSEEEVNDLINSLKPVPEKFVLFCSGIYGIFKDDELVYTGKTSRPFYKRFEEHMNNLYDPAKNHKFIYRMINRWKEEGYQIQARPLICIENLKTRINIGISSMELGLIEMYNPILNIEGKKTLYRGNGYEKHKAN